MVEDDDDSDYGQSKKRGKKVIRRGRPDKKERKSPKPRLKATGEQPQPPFSRWSKTNHLSSRSPGTLLLSRELPVLFTGMFSGR